MRAVRRGPGAAAPPEWGGLDRHFLEDLLKAGHLRLQGLFISVLGVAPAALLELAEGGLWDLGGGFTRLEESMRQCRPTSATLASLADASMKICRWSPGVRPTADACSVADPAPLLPHCPLLLGVYHRAWRVSGGRS